MGLALIPCFLADPEPGLHRIGPMTLSPRFDLWLLKHNDLRANARVRILSDFLAARIKRHRARLTGTAVSTDPNPRDKPPEFPHSS